VSVNHHHILIDGGSTSKNNVGRYQIIPFLKYKGIGKLDAVILTHEDKDHMSGILEVMDDMERGGISIGGLILPEVGESSRGENYHLLEKRASELGIAVSYINLGESFNLGNASFTCLNPELGMVTEEANAYSTVLYMKYGKFTALFTGDMEKEGLDHVKNVLKASQDSPTDICPGDITLLKVAHHGSRYTTDEEFLSLTHPSIALISCGRDNSYGHPHQELLRRLNQINAKLYRTDTSGEITVTYEDGLATVEEYIQN
jgi:competence protein ComEC